MAKQFGATSPSRGSWAGRSSLDPDDFEKMLEAMPIDTFGTAPAAAIEGVANAYGSVAADRLIKTAIKPITGAALHAGVLNWANPEAGAIIILRVILDITTPSTGASTIDIGVTATSATTASDTLLDGVSGTPAAVFDSMNAALDGGANALAQKLALAKWVTFKEASGDVTGLVANAYIQYINV